MWKRKDEEPIANPAKEPIKEVPAVSTMPQERKPEPWGEAQKTVAHIGKSVVIRGELSGSEDLYIDGQVEGSIELREHHLTVGPNGRVQANINAKEVVIQGSVKGNVKAIDRVEIRKSGSLAGDLVAARVVIEDGAFFKGSIDIQKGGDSHARPSEPKRTEAAPPPSDSGKYAGVPLEAKKLN
ncbi:MAG TPA: polymer-forming cytoskeletal protein [Terriglobia bacterium]|jgi:cytoskeletal protein CcmA (bactofilin family)